MAAAGDPPDEALYASLGAAMAAKNGYASRHAFQHYDTTGTTEDWSYYATGGLGFTFEIGPDEFHPPFAEMIAEYRRNREAYLIATQSTANSARHVVLGGSAAPGTILRAHKEFETQTAPVIVDFAGTTGPSRSFRDVLDTTMTVGASGRFEWHLNPSSRPLASPPEPWNITCERPAGTVLARATIVIARGERKAVDLCALRFAFAVDRRRLSRALRRGLRARARCTPSCAASVTLSVDNATARRHGLTKKGKRRVIVGGGDAKGTFKGRKVFGVRFSKTARRHLRGVRRLRVRLSAVGREGASDTRTITRSMTLAG